MIIKIQNLDQLKQIFELEQELFGQHCYTYEQLLDMYNNPSYVYYVFLKDEKVLGYLILMDTVDEYEIIKIGVAKNTQGMGIGSQLMALAKSLEKPLLLEVSSNNTNAISFYEFHKFQLISKRKNYYADGSDALIYKFSDKE